LQRLTHALNLLGTKTEALLVVLADSIHLMDRVHVRIVVLPRLHQVIVNFVQTTAIAASIVVVVVIIVVVVQTAFKKVHRTAVLDFDLEIFEFLIELLIGGKLLKFVGEEDGFDGGCCGGNVISVDWKEKFICI
jgi:hypothetical protein